jgi:hypothetical protein
MPRNRYKSVKNVKKWLKVVESGVKLLMFV